MENFIVSARKYRPIDFKSVVGQSSITVTLKNSVKSKQLAHAYLFCGPRGVGKTTCARIFAKIINCKNPTSDHEACNECESCIAFNEQRSYNIHELDAASNNSVEDIRSLIEQVRIPPQIGTHSVYIIDEVHMLSQSAFNAFLKTLEEPPSYAIFVLATTEKHKILPTILSRCQIFDFKRITINDIVEYLEYVGDSENIKYEKDALNIIAQKSDGAMRDALSFFDQIASFSDKNINYKTTIENLNVLDYDYYFRMTDYILANNYSETLMIFNEILIKGFEGHHFISGLGSHFRDLLVCKDKVTLELLEVGAGIKEKYSSQSEVCEPGFLIRAIDIANNAEINYKSASNKRLQVELALLQMCMITNSDKKKTDEPVSTPIKEEANTTIKESIPKYEKPQNGKSPTNTIKKSGISINNHNEQKQSHQEDEQNLTEINTVVTGTESITQENLDEAWAELVEKFTNQPRLYSALKSERLILTENQKGLLSVHNNSLEQALLKMKTRLLQVLQSKLNNKDFNFEIKVKEQEANSAERLYTDRDKYIYLVKKNPNIEKLKNDFDLEF
jgi:DNA polymerase-3 subunit gamma/tau